MKNLKLILALFEPREKRQLVIILIGLLFMGCIELVGVGSLGPFISIVSNPEMIHGNEYLSRIYTFFHFTSDTGFIIAAGVAVILVLVASNICLALVNFIIYHYSARRYHSLSVKLFEKYLRQPYVFYLNNNSSELSKRILNDVNNFVNSVLLNLLQFISSSIIALSIVVLLIITNPLLALAVSFVFGVSYFIIFSLVRKFLARAGKEADAYQFLRYKYITECFNGVKDIKILGKERVFLNSFSNPSRKLASNNSKRDIAGDVPKYLLETISLGGIVGVIIFMIASGLAIYEFLPVLTVYAFGAYKLLPLLQKIFRAVTNIKYHSPIVENLYNDFRDLSPGDALPDASVPKMNFHRRIRLENIVFQYPSGNSDVIKNQTINIESNTSIALVGATGCGKTTLADIILGLLEPQGGKIYIDGVEINDANRKSWQKNLGYVPQSIYLTDDSIRNNIAFGIEEGKVDDAAVEKAARIANIHDFIAAGMDKGYDTFIGERGIRLSGGQRQRIGIARALYHDPSVLVLDEATSALDGLTENSIIDALKNLSRRKTIIMIAHRLTTVRDCDVIYLMDKGVITDQGSYDELYERNAGFRKMADGR